MQHYRNLARTYEMATFAVLFGDASAATKELFRDKLKVGR